MQIKLYQSTDSPDSLEQHSWLARATVANVANDSNKFILEGATSLEELVSMSIEASKTVSLEEVIVVQIPMRTKELYRAKQTFIHNKRGTITGFSLTGTSQDIYESAKVLEAEFFDALIDSCMTQLQCYNIEVITYEDVLENNILKNLQIRVSLINDNANTI